MEVIDLFAGCGGLTEGFVRVGFKPILAVESNAHAAASYRANFGDHVIRRDITEIPDSSFPEASVVVGGPPCQGFSNLGTRDPDDPRNRLWTEFARVVRVAQPTVFVLENVPQFLQSDQFAMLCEWTDDGPLQQYRLVSGVLNAADYGVPQRRKRAFVIGSRAKLPLLPAPTHGPDAGRPWRTVSDALEGVPFEVETTTLPDRTVDGVPGPFKAHEIHLGRRPTALSLERYDHIPPGGNRFDLPDELLPNCWRNKPTGTTDVMGRLRWDEPALTIRTEFFKPEKGRYLHPQWDEDPAKRVNRPITHWEAARLQSFDDDFVWCGTKTEIARQIGNAVPPALAAAVASEVVDLISV